jgi:uncharacterized protein (DUF1697 family)
VTSYVALLRAVNVGGRNRVPMAELRALCAALDYEDVRTFIQSGNVVLKSTARPAKVARDLAAALRAHFGFDIGVVVRTRAELAEIVAGNPYLDAGAEASRLHVAFLAGRPAAAGIASLDPDRSPPDEFVVRGREIFIRTPNGMGRSKLTPDYFQKCLGTECTARNWNTVTKLLDLVAR